MTSKHIRFPFVIAMAFFGMALANTAMAEQKSGTETVALSQVYGVAMTGSRDPTADAACKQKYGSYMGQKITSQYDINTKTLIMSATSNVFGQSVTLYPLGVSSSYSFMSDGVPAELSGKGVTRVIFSITRTFKNPESRLLATLNATDNCVLSNMAP